MTKFPYSAMENKVLEVLRSNGRTSSAELVDKVYGDNKPPDNARVSINGAVRRLMLKTSYNNETFTVERDDVRGPFPVVYWIEENGKKL